MPSFPELLKRGSHLVVGPSTYNSLSPPIVILVWFLFSFALYNLTCLALSRFLFFSFFFFFRQAIFLYDITALLEILHDYSNQHVKHHETSQ